MNPPIPPLEVARLRFVADLQRPLELPAFAGPLLRGVFGAALRLGACSTGLPRCADCPLYRQCAYPAIFETPPRPTQFDQHFSQVPNPYVVEPPPLGTPGVRAGEPLVFHLVLVGMATQRQLPLIVSAWQRALRQGLGQSRVQGALRSVEAVDAHGQVQPAFDLASHRPAPELPLLDVAALLPPPASALPGVALQLATPLRMQQDSRPLLPEQLSPRVLVSHLLRRINLMLDLHLGIRPAPYDVHALLGLAGELGDDRRMLQWYEARRFSARQGQELPQGGVLGQWLLYGPVAPLLPWLVLGQWLHIGKGATSGLGSYRLLPLGANRP